MLISSAPISSGRRKTDKLCKDKPKQTLLLHESTLAIAFFNYGHSFQPVDVITACQTRRSYHLLRLLADVWRTGVPPAHHRYRFFSYSQMIVQYQWATESQDVTISGNCKVDKPQPHQVGHLSVRFKWTAEHLKLNVQTSEKIQSATH